MLPVYKKTFLFALAFIILAIISDAMASHALAKIFTDREVALWALANKYLFINFTLLLIHCFLPPSRLFTLALSLISFATLVFAFSLYTLCFLELGSLHLLTPIGGGLLILGWILAWIACFINFKK